MTEPYTAEELAEAIKDLEYKASATYWPVRYNRLAATLREYERVVKENAGLRRYLDQRASGTDPLTKQLEAEVAALRADKERLLVALDEYGDHDFCCALTENYPMKDGSPARCTCGFMSFRQSFNAARAAGEG